MNILETLKEKSIERYEKEKAEIPEELVKEKAYTVRKQKEAFRFEKALRRDGLSLIAELKKASPSKGIISKDFPYRTILEEYEKGGADCISCLTEPEYFLGNLEILQDVTSSTELPVLRKDFTVDPYQIYQAAVCGAEAVLLIAAILSDEELRRMMHLCDELGMSALVEAHNEEEIIRSLQAGARILGVNHRNLKDFSMDLTLSAKYRELIPENILFVAESGILSSDDARTMRHNGADAVLVGEYLMRSEDTANRVKEIVTIR